VVAVRALPQSYEIAGGSENMPQFDGFSGGCEVLAFSGNRRCADPAKFAFMPIFT
jgi:hypothetical protein